MRKPSARLTAFMLALALLLTSCGGLGSETAAATMRLKKAEGTVSVADGEGKSVELMENLGLYSGYGVDTWSESYAWIGLDEVKLTKLDENSEVEIVKDGKKLEIEVISGSLFFNVTEPLAEDESMDIRTSTMLVGIRGTCGWVTQDTAALLEGTVTVTAGDQTVTITAGEVAVLTSEGTLEVKPLTAASVPAFVREEVEGDGDWMEAIPDSSDADASGDAWPDVPAEYADTLAKLKEGGEILYTEIVDFEADGNPELLVLHTRDKESHLKERYEKGEELFGVSVFRAGPEGVSDLYFGTPQFGDGGRFSLAGYGDRIVMGTYSVSGDWVKEIYDGSVAEKDGVNPSWSGDDRDWTMLDWIQCLPSRNTYSRTSYDPNRTSFGGLDPISAEEYAATRAKYKELKVLAYSPDGESLIIAPDPSEIEDFSPAAATEPNALLASYAGTYTPYEVFHDSYGDGERLQDVTLSESGAVTGGGTSWSSIDGNGLEPSSVIQKEDGSIEIMFSTSAAVYTVYPPGVVPEGYDSGYWQDELDRSAVHLRYLLVDESAMDVLYYADPASLD